MAQKIMTLVKNDPWLEPVADEVYARYERFKTRLNQIESDYGSLTRFASAYQYYGVHPDTESESWVYREWAPEAHALYLTGDFNQWNPHSHPLNRIENGNWEIRLPYKEYKDCWQHLGKYKVIVHSARGVDYRIPAYAFRVVQDEETRDFAAQYWEEDSFKWGRKKPNLPERGNLLIYEAHIGMAQETYGVGTYAEFESLLPGIKAAGYNAIQLMAIAEHPYYGSFGYHVSNFFAPSSRFGTPTELKSLIQTAHELGLAVIMDLVHSHAIKNINEGLNQFDGTDYQYFHAGPRGEHPDWDSKLFDYGKTEVLQFLLSNIHYWMKEFHFDGFRFDGVGSMMYWHHGHDGPFDQEKFFTKGVEFDALIYLQLANKLIHQVKKGAISIAEDVTGMPGLCAPIHHGGIGFDYRLGMGIPDYWIKILKEQRDEDWNLYQLYETLLNRKFDTPTIAYAESHDQALVGDKTLAFRLMDQEMYYHMRVDDPHPVIDRGIALHKMIRFITLVLGGDAYMNFMGNEFGHPEWIDFPREGNNWSYHYARRQWSLVQNHELRYRFLAQWDSDMLKLVSEHRVMQSDYPQLLNNDDWNKTLIFQRAGLIFVFNFHIFSSIMDYEFYVPDAGNYELILTSDASEYGGFNRVDTSIRYPSFYDRDKGQNRMRIYNVNRSVQVFRRKVEGA